MSEIEKIVVIALDELEREIIKNFLTDWKDKVNLDELTDYQINGLDEAIIRILNKVK